MNATQLEAIVIEAVGRAQAGGALEDDRIEFKRDWPGVEKGRQLAGAANRASGEWLIYIIGVDEVDGSIHPTAALDPASWWAQMEASFDEAAPELVRHLNVRVSETGSVVVLQFRTDRAPYVVRVVNGGATEREIPIRVGTRTRSAHRHELIRLLLPSVSVPALSSLSAFLTAGRPDYLGDDSDTITKFHFVCQVYFEHLGPHFAFLPIHLAHMTLVSGEIRASSQVYYSRSAKAPAASFGVSLRGDGIELSGPGTARLEASWSFPRERHEELGAIDEWRLRLDLGVAGTDREAVLELAVGHRTEEADTGMAARDTTDIRYNWSSHPGSAD